MLDHTDKSIIMDVLKDSMRLRAVSIDAYMTDPYIFVLRSTENSLVAAVENDRIILRRNDEHKTSVMNVPCNCVRDIQYKLMEDCKCRLLFSVSNIWYSVFAELC